MDAQEQILLAKQAETYIYAIIANAQQLKQLLGDNLSFFREAIGREQFAQLLDGHQLMQEIIDLVSYEREKQ